MSRQRSAVFATFSGAARFTTGLPNLFALGALKKSIQFHWALQMFFCAFFLKKNNGEL
jgi:hypothetical protein